MEWVDLELVLISLGAMLLPSTLMFSVLAVVLSKRPLYTGIWFYLGAVAATLAIGVAAAFALGGVAASHDPSSPKTWVAVVDVIAGALLLFWVGHLLRRPPGHAQETGAVDKMRSVASSRWIAVLAAGAALANPGVFIPLALKSISEGDPGTGGYIAEWIVFTLMSLLPLAVAILMLFVAPDRAERILGHARGWLELHARTIAAAVGILVAASLIRGGISGLTS